MVSVDRDRESTSNSAEKTAVSINVYDLLPPGKISTLLWTVGCGLLHTGVVVRNREYAFGGHDKKGVTGVYWMKPRTEPPGGTFRTEIIHGFCFRNEEEINNIILDASEEFLGPSYNLLTRNCNHFTSYLCEKLTGKPAPKYINRAAGIGVTLPCIVPAAWVEPPDCEEPIVGDGFEEQVGLVGTGQSPGRRGSDTTTSSEVSSGDEWGQRTVEALAVVTSSRPHKEVHCQDNYFKDTSGRVVPTAERAPLS